MGLSRYVAFCTFSPTQPPICESSSQIPWVHFHAPGAHLSASVGLDFEYVMPVATDESLGHLSYLSHPKGSRQASSSLPIVSPNGECRGGNTSVRPAPGCGSGSMRLLACDSVVASLPSKGMSLGPQYIPALLHGYIKGTLSVSFPATATLFHVLLLSQPLLLHEATAQGGLL